MLAHIRAHKQGQRESAARIVKAIWSESLWPFWYEKAFGLGNGTNEGMADWSDEVLMMLVQDDLLNCRYNTRSSFLPSLPLPELEELVLDLAKRGNKEAARYRVQLALENRSATQAQLREFIEQFIPEVLPEIPTKA